MTLKPYSVVHILTDRYKDRGIAQGAIGTILDVYNDGAYEVEFSRDDGTTIAWFAVLATEVELLTEGSSAPVTVQIESASN